jgi:phage shock protein C
MTKKLYRSESNRMLSGVCAGIAEYFNLDPTIVRLLWVIASIFLGFGFGGLLAYLVCALVIPVGSNDKRDQADPGAGI